MLHIEEFVGIILYVPRTRKAKALANPSQPHSALLHELERYIQAHDPDATDVNVVSATDTGQADTSHKPVRHWSRVRYEACTCTSAPPGNANTTNHPVTGRAAAAGAATRLPSATHSD